MISTLLAAVLTILIVHQIVYKRPISFPVIGTAYIMLWDPVRNMKWLHWWYGKVFLAKNLMGADTYCFSDLELYKKISGVQSDHFMARGNPAIVKGVEKLSLDSGLVLNPDVNQWKCNKAIMVQAMKDVNIVSKVSSSLMKIYESELVAQFLRASEQKSVVNMSNLFGEVVTKALVGCFFSLEKNNQENDAEITNMINQFCMAGKFFLLTPHQLWGFFKQELAMHEAAVERFSQWEDKVLSSFRQNMANMKDSDDLVSKMMMAAMTLNKEGYNNPMNPDEAMKAVKGLVHDFLIAGIETASNNCTLAFYHLARNPDIQQKLFQEVQNLSFPHEDVYSVVKNLNYLDAVVYETFRCTPTLPINFRTCSKSTKIAISKDSEISIPEGAAIFLNYGLTSLNSDVWPDPKRFDPERFMGPWKNANKKNFYPFGFGKRECAGKQIGLALIKLMVAATIRDFKIELAQPNTPLITKYKLVVAINEEVGHLRFNSRSSLI